MFYNLLSCVLSCHLQTLNIYLKILMHIPGAGEAVKSSRRELLKWWGNLREGNNHQDSAPALWDLLDGPGWSAVHAKQVQSVSCVKSSLLCEWAWPVLLDAQEFRGIRMCCLPH